MKFDLKTSSIARVAGNGKSGFTGNGGDALAATLAGPKSVSVGHDGKVYLADTESHSIRFYDPATKTLNVLIGDGVKATVPMAMIF